ncbi:MAG: ABC transporter substrate-binding protein [Desulfobacterales bacterium]|nr:ABC transporter substrate-binding protein [Desulfobacterales bacterium]
MSLFLTNKHKRPVKMTTNLRIFILITAIILGACASPQKDTPVETVDKTAPEHEVFSKAEESFHRRDYSQALESYNDYLSGSPDGPYAPAALMKEGTIYTESGKYSTARNIYQYLINRYPDSPLVPDARVAILSTYYKEGDYDKVIRRTESVLKNLASEDHIFITYILCGDAYMAAGSPINAVYFYITACKERFRTVPCPMLATPFGREDMSAKIKRTVSRLSSADIKTLMERLNDDPAAAGYIMYMAGASRAGDGRHEEAVNILSEFVRLFPHHKNAQHAKQLMEQYEIPGYYEIGDQYTIGCLLPLSGKYKIYGEKALKGIQLAVSQLGPRIGQAPINILVEDTQSDPNRTVMAVRKLFNDHAAAIIGPFVTAEAAAVEAQEKQIPIITLTQKDKITDIGDYVFRNFITPRMQVKTIVSYAVDRLGIYRFAVLYPDNKYGTAFMNYFQDQVMSYGGEVVATASYNPGATDFAGPIRNIKSGPWPDAIFIPDDPHRVGLIIPQLAFHDITRVQLLGTNLWNSRVLISRARQFVRGAVFPEGFFANSSSEEVSHFTSIFRDTYNKKPGFVEALAYDTARIIFHILDQSGDRIRFTSELKDELARLQDFQGVTGLTSFDSNGEAHKKLYLLRVEGGGFVDIGDF